MKVPLSLGLVLAIGLCGAQALPAAPPSPSPATPPRSAAGSSPIVVVPVPIVPPADAPIPSASPLPSATALPLPSLTPAPSASPTPSDPPSPTPAPSSTPPLPSPTPSSAPSPTPSPSPSASPPFPSPTASVTRVPLFPVPPPNPAPPVAAPPQHAPLPFLDGRPDLSRFQRAVPSIELWRIGSTSPQIPVRRGRFEQLLISGTEPATLVLRWDSALAGQTVGIGGNGVTIQPAGTSFLIGATGQTAFVVQLEPEASAAELNLVTDFVTTTLRLTRAPLSKLIAAETTKTAGAR